MKPITECPYRAFFDRDVNSINGFFTIQDNSSGVKIFNRLTARSGQAGYTHTDWTTAKSPIPFGDHVINLVRPNNIGQLAGYKGIGEFYPISDTPKNTRTICNPKGKQIRWDVGLHPENQLKGSAGCIVIVVDTKEREAEFWRLSKFLKSLIGEYPAIPLTVL